MLFGYIHPLLTVGLIFLLGGVLGFLLAHFLPLPFVRQYLSNMQAPTEPSGSKKVSPQQNSTVSSQTAMLAHTERVILPQVPSAAQPRQPAPNSEREHLLKLVDLLDEIELIKQAEPTQSTALSILEGKVSDMIQLADGEIIRDTSWNPKRQRAVEVKPSSGAVALLASCRLGLQINGNIIRKQEVVISGTL